MKRSILSVAMLVVLLSMGRARAASFQGLGFPGQPPFRQQDNHANAVSADGSVVVGQNSRDGYIGYTTAYRWTEEAGMVALAVPESLGRSAATGVSADGSVVVGGTVESYGAERNPLALRGTVETGLIRLGPGWANAVSADGSVVVGATSPGYLGGEAVYWTETEGMVPLGMLPGANHSSALDVSANGSVVVGRSSVEAFRWTAETAMVGLGFLPGADSSSASGVSADGSVVVGSSGGEAFRWTTETAMVGLGFVDKHQDSYARAVSDDGSVVVGEASGEAFIWTAGSGMRNLQRLLVDDLGLNLDEWGWLFSATDVSADGRVIVGYGIDTSGRQQSWRAVIPEPSGLALLTAAAVGFAVWRWRKRHAS